MLFKIYCLKNQQDEIRYVGYTSLSEARRMAEHRYSHPERRDYTFHVLDVFDTKREALEAERMYIQMLNPPENVASGQGFPGSLVEGRDTAHKRQSKRVYCFETDKYYPSMADAARELGVNRDKIKLCCQGKRKTTSGMHFRFADSNELRDAKEAPGFHADTEITVGIKEPAAS